MTSPSHPTGRRRCVLGHSPSTRDHDTGTPVPMSPQEVASVGSTQSHPNMHPFLCVNFVIALYGIFPSRN